MVEGFVDRTKLYAGVEEFGDIHDAIGTGRLGEFVKFRVIGPELEGFIRFQDFFDLPNDMAGSDPARIGDVVNTEGRAQIPEIQASADEVSAMGDGVHVVVNLGVGLNFGEVIARVVQFVERDAESPEIAVRQWSHGFFSESFGAAVETAGWRAEGEIGRVRFGEAPDDFRFSIFDFRFGTS